MGKVQENKASSIDYRLSIDHRKNFLKEVSMDYRVLREDNSSSRQYVQRSIAEKLLQKLGEPKSWKFYLKCAYHLSEAQIWDFVALATRPSVKNPNRYFVFLANKEMNK